MIQTKASKLINESKENNELSDEEKEPADRGFPVKRSKLGPDTKEVKVDIDADFKMGKKIIAA